MPNTDNFAWVMPTPGGDNNAWGQKLNDMFQQIDDSVETVSDLLDATAAVVASHTSSLTDDAQITKYLGYAAFQPANDESDVAYGSGSGAYLQSDSANSVFYADVELPVGVTLESVDVICDKQSAGVRVDAEVLSTDMTGTVTSRGTGSRSATGVGAASVSVDHVVGAEFITIKVSVPTQINRYRIYGAKVIYTRHSLSETD